MPKITWYFKKKVNHGLWSTVFGVSSSFLKRTCSAIFWHRYALTTKVLWTTCIYVCNMHSLSLCKYDWSNWWQTLTKAQKQPISNGTLSVFGVPTHSLLQPESLFLVFSKYSFGARTISIVSIVKIKQIKPPENWDIWCWRWDIDQELSGCLALLGPWYSTRWKKTSQESGDQLLRGTKLKQANAWKPNY